MIDTLYHYGKKYVAPQWKRLVLDWQWPIALAITAALSWNHSRLRIPITYEVIYQFVSYNFMAFGFTIAALTIVFVVPSDRFTDFMFRASERSPRRGQGPWEDALFLMSWNGLVHFLSLVCSICVLAFCFDYSGDKYPLIYSLDPINNRIVFGGYVFIQIYTIFQFLMTLLSVYFFCASYVRKLRQDRATAAAPSETPPPSPPAPRP